MFGRSVRFYLLTAHFSVVVEDASMYGFEPRRIFGD